MLFKFSAFHLIFIVLLISGCSDQKPVEQEEVLRPVKVLKVEAPSNIKVYEFTAVVDASRKADLAFKIAGEITQIAVKEGDDVEEGQLLAKLDDTDIQIQLKEAQSSFDKAKADYDRAQNLIKTNAISQSDLDQIKASYNSAEAKLLRLQQKLTQERGKANSDFGRIRSLEDDIGKIEKELSSISVSLLKKMM